MFICDACKESFEENHYLIQHTRLTHAGLQLFRCTESHCKKTFSLLNSFIKHRRKKHNLKKENLLLLEGNQSNCSLTPEIEKWILEPQTDFPSQVNSPLYHVEECSDSSDCDSLLEDDLLWNDESLKCTINIVQEISNTPKEVNDHAIKFAGKLYQFPDLPRTRVNTVISDASELLKASLNCVENEICNRLESLGASETYLSEIKDVLQSFAKPFRNIKTESQRFSQFKNYDTYIIPQHYKIGERTEYKSKPTGTTREDVSVTAQFIPVRYVLKKFFEMTDVFTKTMEYVNSIKSNSTIISNLIQYKITYFAI